MPSFLRKISFPAAALGAVLVAALALSTPAAARGTESERRAGPAAKEDAQTDALSELGKALYKAVNKTRSDAGARPLEQDAGLEAIAQDHARDMVDRKYMAHVSPEGAGPRERLLARFPDFTGAMGENIAMRSIRRGESARDTAEAAAEAWLGSPPHRKNMLNQVHGFAGMGVAGNGRALYIVMVLGSEPSLRPPEPEPDPEPQAGTGDSGETGKNATNGLGDSQKPAENSVLETPGS